MQRVFFKKAYEACQNLAIQQGSTGSKGETSSDQKSIIKYILQVQDTMKKEQIISTLQSAGWSDQEITNAFSFVE